MKKITLSPKQQLAVIKPFKEGLEVNEGTPRSGKTTAGHFRLAKFYIPSKDENHLLTAYNQEQAYRLFIDGDGTGLAHIFAGSCKTMHDENGDHLLLNLPSGKKKIYYKGGGKSNSVGAITGMSLGSVAFGEINLLNNEFIQECFRRTFAAEKRWHLADLNPPSPNHPVIDKVFNVQPLDWLHWTPHDNPILSLERKKQLYDTLSQSQYLLDRDWYGKRVMPEGVIYSLFNPLENIKTEIPGRIVEVFFSADGGQSDATSCACNVVVNHEGKFKLVRAFHYYHSGKDDVVKAMSTYAKELIDFMRYCLDYLKTSYSYVFVDPACKSLREELRKLGVPTNGADNNRSDVKGILKGLEVGIERLHSAMSERIFLLSELSDKWHHKSFLQEIESYVRLDNGKPIDAFNHSLDECRYAYNYFFKKYIK